jgi:hypothetical protein
VGSIEPGPSWYNAGDLENFIVTFGIVINKFALFGIKLLVFLMHSTNLTARIVYTYVT